jgi:hypothetical protein
MANAAVVSTVLLVMAESDIPTLGMPRPGPAAATTIARKRAVFFNALELAVERGLLTVNPLTQIRWKTPKAPEAIDPSCVVNPEQAVRDALNGIAWMPPRNTTASALAA